jgi:hypothetical protein
MDKSKVREIVREHAESLMEQLGIPHWKIDFYYNLRVSDGNHTVKGRCTKSINYNQAMVELDPDSFDDEAEVLKIIRHELLHVVLSPFDLFRQVADEMWKADPTRESMMDRVWDHAVEQAVVNLERMHRGLTRKPEESPDVKKSAPKTEVAYTGKKTATPKKAAPKKAKKK